MTTYLQLAEKALHDQPLTAAESRAVLNAPDDDLLALLHAAFVVRSKYFGRTVRLQMLQNAKSGACQEDCHYCSQSSVSTAPIERYNLLPRSRMIEGARLASASKAQRYCIVISGRSPLDREIEEIAEAVRSIKQEIPIQICCSLGLLSEAQAKRLKEAGVDRVNHNLNTSEAYHPSICTTHTFQDRLATIRNARAAGLEICSGGIVGMGETVRDRARMLQTLASLPQHPESVPINQLVQVAGTPLAGSAPLDPFDFVRAIAVARILMPRAHVRLSAGRSDMSDELQALCFLAGANSIFYGDRLLTTGNPDWEHDRRLFERLGLRPAESNAREATT